MSSPPASAPPTNVFANFAADERIHFDQQSGKWAFEDDDGTEMEWDMAKSAWVPVVDEELLQAQQAAYSVAGVDESVPAAPVLARTSKKRKEVDYTSNTAPTESGPSIKRGKSNNKAGSDQPPPKSKNTAAFVTGLPPDTTVQELADRFSKCGLIMEDDDEQPRIKMYAFDDGTFNGEALVVYFKEESVELAIRLLDEAELRLGEPSTTMRVSKSDFGHKTDPSKQTVKRVIDKKKASKRIHRMMGKLADWDSEDEFGPAPDPGMKAAPKSRTVLLKHMFTLAELEEDATLLLDLKEEVREECETLGEVTNVVLYDKEPEGIMTVKFKDLVSAQACILKMNGRFFAGRQVIAMLYDSKHKYQRSGGELEADAEDEKKRLDAFASWLEKGGDEDML